MKILFGMVFGGVIGFLVGIYGKCTDGPCPFTNNPIATTIVGAVFGGLIAMGK